MTELPLHMPIAETPEKQAIFELLAVVDSFVEHWRSQIPMTPAEQARLYDSYAFAREVVGLPPLVSQPPDPPS